jgi:hypothetical protein
MLDMASGPLILKAINKALGRSSDTFKPSQEEKAINKLLQERPDLPESSPIEPSDVIPKRIREIKRDPNKTARDMMQDIPLSRGHTDEGLGMITIPVHRGMDEFLDAKGVQRVRTDFDIDILDLEARVDQRIKGLESAFKGHDVPPEIQGFKDRLKTAVKEQDSHAMEDMLDEMDAPVKAVDPEREAIMNEQFFPETTRFDYTKRIREEAGRPKNTQSSVDRAPAERQFGEESISRSPIPRKRGEVSSFPEDFRSKKGTPPAPKRKPPKQEPPIPDPLGEGDFINLPLFRKADEKSRLLEALKRIESSGETSPAPSRPSTPTSKGKSRIGTLAPFIRKQLEEKHGIKIPEDATPDQVRELIKGVNKVPQSKGLSKPTSSSLDTPTQQFLVRDEADVGEGILEIIGIARKHVDKGLETVDKDGMFPLDLDAMMDEAIDAQIKAQGKSSVLIRTLDDALKEAEPFGLEAEVRHSYNQGIKRGMSEQDAAGFALGEWDI